MDHLERLIIRTVGALTSAQAHVGHSTERSMFRGWVGTAPSHPTLHYIGVWQRANDHGGVLSEWSREDGTWVGKWTQAPDQYQVMDYE